MAATPERRTCCYQIGGKNPRKCTSRILTDSIYCGKHKPEFMAKKAALVNLYNATTRREKYMEYQRRYNDEVRSVRQKMKRKALLATGTPSDGQTGATTIAGVLAAEPFTEMAVAGALV